MMFGMAGCMKVSHLARETLLKQAESRPKQMDNEPTVQLRTATLPSLLIKPRIAGVTGEVEAVWMQVEGDDPDTDREGTVRPSDETVPDRSTMQVAVAKNVFEEEGRRPNILIVEDTEELAEVIQATLENKGMKVTWVSHGERGLEQIQSQEPDIVLLDIGLPDMTGWKMLEEVRKSKETPEDMPTIIVISAYGDPANRLIGKLQGVHSYLIKPFTSDEVEQVVQGALGRA